MIPTVHMNGTGKQALMDETRDAYKAIMDAKEKLLQMTVHGRDYYVQSPDAYSVARAEHHARVQKLSDLEDELIDYYRAIEKQG